MFFFFEVVHLNLEVFTGTLERIEIIIFVFIIFTFINVSFYYFI